MDRLPFVIALGLLAAGCDEHTPPSAPPPGRVVAVQAEEGPERAVCDREIAAADAQPMVWPALAEGDVAPTGPGPRWINVWATWCHPCVEELPRLVEWDQQLEAQGAPIEMVFLSADADAETVAAFRETHTEAPDSIRIADPATLGEWVGQIGLDAGASLPIHILTDARGRVRCLRAGAVGEEDYPAVRAAIQAL